MKNYVFCKQDNCQECNRKCPSVSNILHGVVFKLPIIKQIYDYVSHKQFVRGLELEEEMLEKYGDCENESIKLIFGVLSGDEFCREDGANLYTMNDLDVIYDKRTTFLAAKGGAKINPAKLRNLVKKANAKKKEPKQEDVSKFADGGQLNVIPDGALHKNLNHLGFRILKDDEYTVLVENKRTYITPKNKNLSIYVIKSQSYEMEQCSDYTILKPFLDYLENVS